MFVLVQTVRTYHVTDPSFMRLTQHRPKAAYELLLALAEPRPVRFDGCVQPGGELGVQGTQSRCLPNAT